jgi:hypothetical protein
VFWSWVFHDSNERLNAAQLVQFVSDCVESPADMGSFKELSMRDQYI